MQETGLNSGPGTFHALQSSKARVAPATEPTSQNQCSATQEATVMRSLPTAAKKVAPTRHNQRKPVQQQRPNTDKNK